MNHGPKQQKQKTKSWKQPHITQGAGGWVSAKTPKGMSRLWDKNVRKHRLERVVKAADARCLNTRDISARAGRKNIFFRNILVFPRQPTRPGAGGSMTLDTWITIEIRQCLVWVIRAVAEEEEGTQEWSLTQIVAEKGEGAPEWDQTTFYRQHHKKGYVRVHISSQHKTPMYHTYRSTDR